MKAHASALVGVVVSGGLVAGLLWWAHARDTSQRERMAKDDPTIQPISLFPALKVGDVVLVDSALARLPSPFSQVPRVLMHVDMVLQDPAVVSVATQPPGSPRLPGVPFFSGTIPKTSILNVTPRPSFEV